jgi:hypothetical protein
MLSLFHLVPAPASAAEIPYLEGVLASAHRQKLHEERTWNVLLHYTKTLAGGYRSRIDDPKFFLSPDGRTDRQAELDATLRSFFLPDQKDGNHGACRFPARLEWLKSRLELDPAALPPAICSEREKTLASIDAKSAVLVFPVGHVNSPASMFGHTLIRIDGSSRSNLISYAVNYAADAIDANGFLYAWKGLTGRYKGYYSVLSYYTKVKEYSDLEHRDMWEYRLKLSEDEVRKMINHSWELNNISSSYYFLDENCSYNLLFLIEAARPELQLAEKTSIFVLPTDTIRIALASGILEEAHYRPSQGTRIRKMLTLLDGDRQQLAFDLAYAVKAPDQLAPTIDAAGKMKVLDLAAEFTQFRLSRKELDKSAYNKLYLRLLGERSKLGTAVDGLYDPEQPAKPEVGHDTSKVAVGAGVRRGEAFAQLELQPAFHSILDPDQGYLKGAQIKFLNTVLRFNEDRPLRVKSLRLVDILSVTPRDIFFKPLSWKVNAGIDQEAMRDGRDDLLFRVNAGGGLTYATPFGGLAYGMGELDFNAGDKIRAKAAAGPGFTLGDLEQLTDWWKLHLYASGFVYKLGDDRYSLKLSADQNFRLTRNNSLSLTYTRQYLNSRQLEDIAGSWNYYF